MSDQVLVAIITGGFGLLAAFIEVTRRQNNRDHGYNSAKLDHLVDGQHRIESKVDTHINDHARGDV
jgi:hypothetical protein